MTADLAREILRSVFPGRPCALTIGVFDGVHRGHQHLLQCLKGWSEEAGLATVALTFYPHPRQILQPQSPITYLCGLEDRVNLLRAEGLNAVAVLPFTSYLAQMSARRFMTMLVDDLQMRLLVVGPDFALGRNREGTAPILAEMGGEMGFGVKQVEPLLSNGEKLGSSVVRAALAQGDVSTATRLLGRFFSLVGQVVRGNERGRLIGFPTANLEVGADQAIPAHGVYATRAYLRDAVYPAVTNIGIRPTFGENRLTIETHILDFHDGLYGHELRIELLERLRGEQRFGAPEMLIGQIEKDIALARKVLA